MNLVFRNNPFKVENPAKVAVAFLPGPDRREIYVYYPDGMGLSKPKLPLSDAAVTVRNMNTVGKLVAVMEAASD